MTCSTCGAILRRANVGPMCAPCVDARVANRGHDPDCPYPQHGVCECPTGHRVTFYRLVAQGGWRRRALCIGKEPPSGIIDRRAPTWFPDRSSEGRDTEMESERRARRYCARCPVRRECLTSAFMHREEHGMWGGVLAEQIRADLERIAAGTWTLQDAIAYRLEGSWEQAVADGLVDKEEVA